MLEAFGFGLGLDFVVIMVGGTNAEERTTILDGGPRLTGVDRGGGGLGFVAGAAGELKEADERIISLRVIELDAFE